ncbi:MAG: response regulator transcription factor [Opitutus sp.]|nr:response regulator transcription factor [Opitutus sp.]
MNFDGTILLIDDEAHIRKFVGLILKQQLGNPTILEAANGQEGIDAYQRESPDLVLLDISMPVMDGLQTLRRLKEIDPDCLVVMLTSMANRQTVEDAQVHGAVNYIRKDTPKEEIARAIAQTVATYFEADPADASA